MTSSKFEFIPRYDFGDIPSMRLTSINEVISNVTPELYSHCNLVLEYDLLKRQILFPVSNVVRYGR